MAEKIYILLSYPKHAQFVTLLETSEAILEKYCIYKIQVDFLVDNTDTELFRSRDRSVVPGQVQ